MQVSHLTEYKQHPLGKLLPPIGDDEFKELCTNIFERGLQQPIMLHEGMILDGWHRYKACRKRKIKLRVVTYANQADTARQYVISQNIHRRHLTVAHRVALAKQFLQIETENAAERGRVLSRRSSSRVAPTGANLEPGKATAAVAKAVGVSARSVERSIAIDKKAIPEIIDAVASGEMSLSEGERVSKMPPRRQRQIIDTPKAGRLIAAKTTTRGRRARIAKKKKRVEFDSGNPMHAAMLQDGIDGVRSLEERWDVSAANLLSDILVRQAYWDKEFPAWRTFARSSALLTLNTEAVTAFTSLSTAIGAVETVQALVAA